MFQCIGCAKPPVDDDVDDRAENGTPKAVKSLTAQIKDMALKFTGRNKGSSSTNQREVRSSDPDSSDSNSEVLVQQHPSMDQRFIIRRTNMTAAGNQSPIRHHLVEIPPGARGLLPEYEANQWMSQVQPGIYVTLVSLPNGENELRRIRFSLDIYDKSRARHWWDENYDMLIERYNVRRLNNEAVNTPPNSDDDDEDRDPYSRQPSARDSPVAAWLNNDANRTRNQYDSNNPLPGFTTLEIHGSSSNNQNMQAVEDASTFFAGEELSFNNIGNQEIFGEWTEQDEPGVFLTINLLADGSKQLRCVKFSRQMFGRDDANIWWEGNKERIQAQYLQQ